MKKIMIVLVMLLTSFSIVSCDVLSQQSQETAITFIGKTETIEWHQVSFYVDNILKASKTVEHGSMIGTMPQAEEKDFMEFEGWYSTDGKKYLSETIVNTDIQLYAKYSVNYLSLMNEVSTNIIKGIVQIEATYYDTGFLGIITKSTVGNGSGVIIHEQDGYYYVLTNNHVAMNYDYENAKYVVTDCLGNEYKAYYYPDSGKAEYDLALLYFVKEITDLKVIDFASANPKAGDEIIAIGQPNLQTNTITFGEVTTYRQINFVTPIDESVVEFAVIIHSAPTSGGSSGGALLNFNFELVGLNFAVESTDNEFGEYGCSVPIEKIKKYMNDYIYT